MLSEKVLTDEALFDSLDLRTVDGLRTDLVTSHFSPVRIPEGYGYKGSAARALALRNLHIDPSYLPRDTDLIRITEEPFPGADNHYAYTHMPDDFAHGWGIEVVNNLNEYFGTRDFTLNEVIATDEMLIATQRCIEDSRGGVVRLSAYEHDLFDGPGPRMVSKMLRFYSEIKYRRGFAELANTSGRENEAGATTAFWMAEQLERAYQHGEVYAAAFVAELCSRGHLPRDLTAQEATAHLKELLPEDPDYYRFPIRGRFANKVIWQSIS
ncbi:MAG: hypothetical protein Q8Q11_01105 [bacterium]|nr:hypothetical protein [bacterium]MDZ4247848.1 hypothetical protein [Patescibacteria group bacterium]